MDEELRSSTAASYEEEKDYSVDFWGTLQCSMLKESFL